MKYIKHKIPVPDYHSFTVNELNMCNKRGIIHSHKNYELNFVVNARGRRFVDGNIANFIEGDLVLMGPEIAHGWEVMNIKEQPRSITIHFAEGFFQSDLFNLPEFECLRSIINQSKYGLHFSDINPGFFEKKLRALMKKEGFDAMIQLLVILRRISHCETIDLLSSSENVWEDRLTNDERINKIYDYVFRNFHNNIRLQEVASLVNLSKSAFCTYFKKTIRKSFFTFLKETRINFACKLLTTEKNRTISQVAFESGYKNIANFNRQFREINHMSPKEYRKEYG